MNSYVYFFTESSTIKLFLFVFLKVGKDHFLFAYMCFTKDGFQLNQWSFCFSPSNYHCLSVT